MSKIEILEESQVIMILLALLKTPNQSFSELHKKLKGSNNTTHIRIKELEREKLITETYEKKFQGKRLINLTKEGKEIAELLDKINIKLDEFN